MIVNSEIGPEEIKVFMDEAEEHIQHLDRDIIKLEAQSTNPELLQEIFRSVHTLKGSSAMLGHDRMAELTHAMEGLLDKLRNHKLSVNPDIIDTLLAGVDALKVLKTEVISQMESDFDIRPVMCRLNNEASVAAGGGGVENDTDNQTNIMSKSRRLVLGKKATAKLAEARQKGLNTYVVKACIDDASAWKPMRCLQIHNDLKAMGEILASAPTFAEINHEKVLPEFRAILNSKCEQDEIERTLKLISEVVTVEAALYGSRQASNLMKACACTKAVTSRGRSEEIIRGEKFVSSGEKIEVLRSIRVDLRVLDALMNRVDEVVVGQWRINQIGKMLEFKYPEDNLVHDLGITCNETAKVMNNVYQDVMRVRMVPISVVFSKFPRFVRDTAKKLYKNLDFVIKGASTELDRTVVDNIQVPLVHLLRNAIDHGIETPEERKAQGKAPKAIVRLSAYREKGCIVIKLEDDGRGIDPKKVRESAVNNGVISSASAAELTDIEIIDLIFSPGISTARETTEVSGRGVGLDIVKTNIERLNGNVAVQTRAGEGTTFIIRLPLTDVDYQFKRDAQRVIESNVLLQAEGDYAPEENSVDEHISAGTGQADTLYRNEITPDRDLTRVPKSLKHLLSGNDVKETVSK